MPLYQTIVSNTSDIAEPYSFVSFLARGCGGEDYMMRVTVCVVVILTQDCNKAKRGNISKLLSLCLICLFLSQSC